jgi:hypothetical protein
MPFIEAPTNFYMGRRYDPSKQRVTDDVVYYDSRDLNTHAVVVGMTGSGKTGLCITLLEEAILDNIPAIVIDPKGDITNLMMTFPELRPTDFQPWVNPDDAARAGLSLPDYAADTAQRWRDGLASWGIVPDRLRWLQLASQISIYTPGSDAGLPISILASLRAPREGWAGHEESHRERINGTVTALLSLIGIDAQPVQDKEHVLIANIFEYAWSRGQDLTLEDVILQVQDPPFDKLGVFTIDKYISEKVRYKLAMEMNNIIAAPSFQSWTNGEPLDIQNLLYRPDGRPRVAIFYIAHLSETERRFMITLLLENMLGWMRSLSGTTSLRALLYIDEMFGYFPPYPKNPPTKEPLLRLLKQARAFGIGLVLATQNPGDLDYKGLSNAGTWFIGRLQSENDRDKVIDGLRSLSNADSSLNLRDVEQLISQIEPRIFVMQNVHNEGGPIMVHTRWAMNYLRGPLTRQQVRLLMTDQRQQLLNSRYARVEATYGGQQQQPPAAAPPQQSYPAQAAPPPPQSTPPPQYQQPSAPPPPPGLPETSPPPGLPEFGNDYGTQGAPQQPSYAPWQSQSPTQGGYTPPPQNYPTQTYHSQPYQSQPAPQHINAPLGYSDQKPPVPSSVNQYFLPNSLTSQQAVIDWEQRTNFSAQAITDTVLAYRPVLLAQTSVRFTDRKTNTYTARGYAYHIPDLPSTGIIHWEEHEAQPIDTRRIGGDAFGQAVYANLPDGLTESQRLASLKRELTDFIYNTKRMQIPFNSTLKIYGNPDGEFNEFRAQVTQAAREERDKEIDKLTAKYEGIMDKLEEKLRKTAQRLESEKRELAIQKRDELFTTGEAVMGLLRGRTSYTLSRMSRSAVYRERAKGDVDQYSHEMTEVDRDIQQAEQEFEAQLNSINEKWAKIAQQTEEHLITPYKKDIMVDLFGIGWIPFWYTMINGQALMLPAYV